MLFSLLICRGVMVMGFCSRCGKELSEDAYFCPKCGVKTRRGVEAGVPTPFPSEDLKEAFSKMGQEMERAFSIAAKEIQKAFGTVRESVGESGRREPAVCPHCGEKNVGDAKFCYGCGKELH